MQVQIQKTIVSHLMSVYKISRETGAFERTLLTLADVPHGYYSTSSFNPETRKFVFSYHRYSEFLASDILKLQQFLNVTTQENSRH